MNGRSLRVRRAGKRSFRVHDGSVAEPSAEYAFRKTKRCQGRHGTGSTERLPARRVKASHPKQFKAIAFG
jgi:predicted TIM-barrel enzyme